MFKRILQKILNTDLENKFKNKDILQRYQEWDKPLRQTQISIVMFLTAFLYVGFYFIDRSWAPDDVQELMNQLHFLIVIPLLLLLSYMAFLKKFYKALLPCVAFFPLISMSIHMYINSRFNTNIIFLPEGYLGIVWIYLFSGLPFRYAIVSSLLTSVILITGGKYFIDPIYFSMHVYWVFCCFAFGFIGSIIFEKTRKAFFLVQSNLQKLATTDSLTGVFNRSVFDQKLNDMLEDNCKTNIALIMVDIDHFKRINDTNGHDKGDQVIKQTAKTLIESMNSSHTLIRWGGEEFAIIINDIQSINLKAYCEKLRLSIEQETFSETPKVTISLGATICLETDTKDSLLSRADLALYSAKDNGRNTVQIK